MIVDAVIFSGEMEMLEFRMRLIAPCVDLFVVVEGDLTFQGTPREWALGGATWPKLRSYQARLDPALGAWDREQQQRNAIETACWKLADDDLMILSDVDEIPNRQTIKAVSKSTDLKATVCRMFPFYYNFRCLWSDMNNGSIFSTIGEMRKLSPQGLRNLRHSLPEIPGAGWHLSYFGGTKKIQEKLKSFAHEEYNRPEFLDESHLELCQYNGTDLLRRGGNTSRPVGKDFFPGYFVEAANPNWF